MHALFETRFNQLLNLPDADMPLAEAALLIATDEYPELDVRAYLRQIDELGRELNERVPSGATAERRVRELNRFLFEDQGFTGNHHNYLDPRNSFLNDVLDRRYGIPISLSILYIEVGRRAGLPLQGVSFPGRFLVKFPLSGGEVVLDPFAKGTSLSQDDLEGILDTIMSAENLEKPPLARLLAPAQKREIILRVLRTLKIIYTQTKILDKGLRVIDRILLVDPDRPVEWRDRADIYLELECFRAACDDYTKYLRLVPRAKDATEVQEKVVQLRKRVARLH